MKLFDINKRKLELGIQDNGVYSFESIRIAKHLRDARRFGNMYDFDKIVELNKQGYYFDFYLDGKVSCRKV